MFIGLPGSGKTTAAKKYQKEYFLNTEKEIAIFEADDYFTNSKGEYKFDAKKLKAAHHRCYLKTRIQLIQENDVIVSNTFLTPKEREPYLKAAKEYDYDVEVITCSGKFKNVHNVPKKTMEKMKNKFIPYSEKEFEKIQK